VSKIFERFFNRVSHLRKSGDSRGECTGSKFFPGYEGCTNDECIVCMLILLGMQKRGETTISKSRLDRHHGIGVETNPSFMVADFEE
jgi:hypothetical protein